MNGDDAPAFVYGLMLPLTPGQEAARARYPGAAFCRMQQAVLVEPQGILLDEAGDEIAVVEWEP